MRIELIDQRLSFEVVFRQALEHFPAHFHAGDDIKKLFHCAFGLEGNAIVLGGALALENMDLNEFQAVIDEMGMAVSKQYPLLSKFRTVA